MMEQDKAQRALAACSSLCRASSARWAYVRSHGALLWHQYKPHTLIGWTAFLGASLLATSALCTALSILCGLMLSLAWVGVVVYTMLVVLSTFGALMMGTAMFILSGMCAMLGICILSGACTAFVGLTLFNKLRAVAQSYMSCVQQSNMPSTAGVAPINPHATLKPAAQDSPLNPGNDISTAGDNGTHCAKVRTAEPPHLHQQIPQSTTALAAPPAGSGTPQQSLAVGSAASVVSNNQSGACTADGSASSSQSCSAATAAAADCGILFREQMQRAAVV